MLKFLATTKNIKIKKSKEPIYNRGKVVGKVAGNCYSKFSDILSYESRAVLFLSEVRKQSRVEGEQIRVDQSEPSLER